MLAWIGEFGDLARIGVEGTGSYGAGLTRHLAKAGIMILEVDRPDRSDRRRKGKDDDLDAINAARAALHRRRTSIPKSKDGAVEALRVLRVTAPTRPGSAAAPCGSFGCRSSPRRRNCATRSVA
jgi:transposase